MMRTEVFDSNSLWRGYVGASSGRVITAFTERWSLMPSQPALAGLPPSLIVEEPVEYSSSSVFLPQMLNVECTPAQIPNSSIRIP